MTAPLEADRLDPQLRPMFRFAPNPPIRWAWGRALVRGVLQTLPQPRLPEGVRREVVDVPGGEHVRVFTRAGGGNGAAPLYVHGGGMVIGSASHEDARLGRVAAELDIVAVSVECRLALEHAFPAPLHDCFAAWGWLQRRPRNAASTRTASSLGGRSAGRRTRRRSRCTCSHRC